MVDMSIEHCILYKCRDTHRCELVLPKEQLYLHKFEESGMDPAAELPEQVCTHLARSRTPAESLLVNQVRKT